MKYLAAFITDTHLCDFSVDINLSIFNQLINICLENKIKYVFHTGDVLNDRKSKQTKITFDTLDQILSMFNKNDITLFAISGNHDKLNYTSPNSWLDTFRHFPKFNLISTADYFDIENYRFHMVSYFDEKVNYLDYLNESIKHIDKSKINILLTHVGISGVKNNDGSKVENELPINLFLKYHKVLIGHYHNKQYLEKGQIHYFGSSYQADYGEDPDKGITLLREDGVFEFIPLQFSKYLTLRVDLDKMSKKQYEPLLQEAISHKEKSNDNIRFEFIGSSAKLKSLDQEQYKTLGIDVKVKSKEIELIEIEKYLEVTQYSIEDLQKLFDEFCTQEGIDKKIGFNYLSKKLK